MALSTCKILQSFFFCPEQEDIVSRPRWTLQPLCSLGHPEELCAEMLKGTEWALSWLYAAAWTQISCLKLIFKQAKNTVQCEEKKNTRQPPDAATVEGRRQEWIQAHFFDSVVQKKSEYLSLHSCLFRSYTQHSGENQIPLHSMKTYLPFSLKRQSMSEWEKSSVKKIINKLYF